MQSSSPNWLFLFPSHLSFPSQASSPVSFPLTSLPPRTSFEKWHRHIPKAQRGKLFNAPQCGKGCCTKGQRRTWNFCWASGDPALQFCRSTGEQEALLCSHVQGTVLLIPSFSRQARRQLPLIKSVVATKQVQIWGNAGQLEWSPGCVWD